MLRFLKTNYSGDESEPIQVVLTDEFDSLKVKASISAIKVVKT